MTLKNLALKYAVDKILAVILLVLLSPLILIVSLAILLEGLIWKESRGGVFMAETRISQDKPFLLYKFRFLKAAVIEKMSNNDSATFYQYKTENTTRVGKILIKCYLDEVPQFFNVLLGQLSIVGPRPRVPMVYKKDLLQGYTALKYLRAGVTGPRQICKGMPICSPEQNEEYVEKCRTYSPLRLLFYDLGIVFKTLATMQRAQGL